MVKELAEAVDCFDGPTHQIRCFAHILNLVAKTIITQFDSKKGVRGEKDALKDTEAQAAALADIVAGLDVELPGLDEAEVSGEEEGDVDDDIDGWIDEREDLSEDEKDELRADVLPVKLILAKVSCDALLYVQSH